MRECLAVEVSLKTLAGRENTAVAITLPRADAEYVVAVMASLCTFQTDEATESSETGPASKHLLLCPLGRAESRFQERAAVPQGSRVSIDSSVIG